MPLNSRIESNKEEEEDTVVEMVRRASLALGGSAATLHSESAHTVERIFIELMTSDRKLKASREGSK